MQNYEEGDKVFLFGFSRGAFTARAVAGMTHMYGLLDRDQENLIPYLSRAFVKADFSVMGRYRGFASRRVPIAFLGLWDNG